MKILSMVILAFIVSFSGQVSAGNIILCDDCSNYYHKGQQLSSGVGYIIDMPNGVLKKYSVETETIVEPDAPPIFVKRVKELSLSGDEESKFLEMKSRLNDLGVYHLGNGNIEVSLNAEDYDVTGEANNSDVGAFDLAINSGWRNDFLMGLHNENPVSWALKAMDAAMTILGDPDALNITYRILFKDGTSIVVQYDSGRRTYKILNYMDAGSNNIFVDGGDGSGATSGLITHSALMQFVNVASAYGISGVPGGEQIILSCTWNGATLSCKVKRR